MLLDQLIRFASFLYAICMCLLNAYHFDFLRLHCFLLISSFHNDCSAMGFFSLRSSSFESAVNVCFLADVITVSICLFFFSFPFLSRSELPAGCCCLLGVCNNPEPFRPLSFPPLLPWQPPCCNLFGSTRGNFGPKSPRGKTLLLCNIIRSHDVMMGRPFNFVYALSTTDRRSCHCPAVTVKGAQRTR